MEQQEKAEIVEEMPETEALFDEKGQGKVVKEALEKEDLDAIAWRKRSLYVCGFCIVVIIILYLSYN